MDIKMEKFNLEKAREGCVLVAKDGASEYIFYAYNSSKRVVFVRPVVNPKGYLYEFKEDDIFIKE